MLYFKFFSITSFIDVVEEEKRLELSGSPLNEEPEEVKVAREEITNLLAEHQKTEQIKNNVLKELENSRDRALRIEDVSCNAFKDFIPSLIFYVN